MNVIHERLIRYWIPAAISGGAGLLGGAIDAISNAVQGKKNREAQVQENEKNRQWQERMWLQHESPQAQAQNMRAAGLNPTGQVSSQSVGSASTSPLPTPSPFTLGNTIAGAGQAVANNLHARQALKLQRDQFNQTVITDTRKFLIELKQLNLSEQETNALIKSKEEEIRGMKLKNDIEQLNLTMLQEFKDAGGNTYTDASNLTQAQTEFTNAQKKYQELMAKIANEQNEYQINVLKAEAESLKANATQAYANALLANAQAEVAKSQKISIDNQTRIANNDEGRRAALHTLELLEKQLINKGLEYDNIRKFLENTRTRIYDGYFRDFGEFGNFFYHNLKSLIPFTAPLHR